MSEKRIYIVVAKKIKVADERTVVQPPGRQMAQVAHVSGKLRHFEARKDPRLDYHPITTIIKQARDVEELVHVWNLADKNGIRIYGFADTNLDAYGPGAWPTAIATEPVDPTEIEGVLDYLPLWGE